NKENTTIKEQFSEIYKGDLSSLLENAEKYKSTIETINERLKLIEKQEEKLLIVEKNKIEISTILNTELNKQVELINNAWANILSGNTSWTAEQMLLMNQILSDREINIQGKIYFNIKNFYDGLRECINGTYWRNKNKEGELENHFKITDELSFFNFLKNRLSAELIENKDYYYITEVEDYFYSLKKRQKYLYVQPEITYKHKTLDKISVGQRGTVYLCLKLATSTFSTPIIYDQPEDDLDNQFIINELVGIFKSIKKFRQVIIVTHNANLVVNSDTEQVIVAQNIDETLIYYSGSLENEIIINDVCKILEGGKNAFEQRRNRYKLK
ncbi:MAG: DNA repair protein, partial [Bacteroidetes bacterium]|nr:DNA repair protein [Bacteroidota bacterium]